MSCLSAALRSTHCSVAAASLENSKPQPRSGGGAGTSAASKSRATERDTPPMDTTPASDDTSVATGAGGAARASGGGRGRGAGAGAFGGGGGAGAGGAAAASISPPTTHLQLSQPSTGWLTRARATPRPLSFTSSTASAASVASSVTRADDCSMPARTSAPGALTRYSPGSMLGGHDGGQLEFLGCSKFKSLCFPRCELLSRGMDQKESQP